VSFIKRILSREKKTDKGTISYGETVQVEHRRKNWERRIEEFKNTIVCTRPEGPCEKMSVQECMKCKYLSDPHEMHKIAFITSQSHGEIGERFPIHADNHEAWRELYDLYIDYRAEFEHTRTDVASPTELLQLLQALLGIQGVSKFPVDMLGTKKE